MRIQKSQIKAMADKVNVKYKDFLKMADELYTYLGE